MILWNWWWLVLVVLITVVISTVAFTYTSTPEYETKVRLVVSPAAITTTDLKELRASITALDKPIVANTYAEIGQSPSIVQAAWAQLEMKPRKDFEVETSVLQETSIIIIIVTGPDPVLIEQLATAVYEQTLEYVSELYEVYDLILLDPPTLPDEPSSPNKKLNLVLGVVLGLGLGVICAFLAEYLKTPLEQVEQLSIVDAQTGAYKSSYFLRRLRSEIGRSQRVQRPFMIGVVRLENFEEMLDNLPPHTAQMILKQTVHLIKQTLPDENLVAQWRDNMIALLMPDCDPETAHQTLKIVQTKLNWTAFEVGETGYKLNFMASFGLAEYDLNGISPEVLLHRAEESLQQQDEA